MGTSYLLVQTSLLYYSYRLMCGMAIISHLEILGVIILADRVSVGGRRLYQHVGSYRLPVYLFRHLHCRMYGI